MRKSRKISSNRRSRRNFKSKTKKQCQQYIQSKIAINMKELSKGRFVSPKQAVAVGYNQIKTKYPYCKRYLKSKKRSKRKSRK